MTLNRRQFMQRLAALGGSAALSRLNLARALAQTAEGRVEIWGYGEPMLGHFEAWQPELEARYTGLEMVLRDFGYLELHANIANALVSGVGIPDVVNYDVSYVSDFAPALLDLTELMAPYADEFMPNALQLATDTEGRLLGLPQDNEPMGIAYRADIFERYGVTEDDCATWDGFIEAAQKINTDSGGEIHMMAMDAPGSQMPVFGVPHQIHEVFFHLAGYHGVFFNKADTEVIIDQPAALAAMEVFKRVADEAALTLQTPDSSLAAYQSGLIAANICPAWFPLGLQLGLPEQTGNWRIMRLPALEEGGLRTAFQISTVTGIPADAPNPEAAWQVMFDAQLSEEAQFRFFETSGGVLPTRVDVVEALATREIEYFGGQRIYALFNEILADLPDVFFGRGWVEARAIMTSRIEPIIRGDVTVEEGIVAAADEMRRRLNKA